ncbi:uncharacterized protein METZ01_LOCUS303188, partial [marine metagenome]
MPSYRGLAWASCCTQELKSARSTAGVVLIPTTELGRRTNSTDCI